MRRLSKTEALKMETSGRSAVFEVYERNQKHCTPLGAYQRNEAPAPEKKLSDEAFSPNPALTSS